MAEIQAAIRTTWGDATPAQAALRTTWGDAADVQSVGGAPYVPPEVPGGLPVVPGGLAPQVDIPERVLHEVTHSMLVYDLRADTEDPLPVRSGSLTLQQGSALWELRAEGDASLYETFRNSEQPPLVAVRIGGQEWHCVVEGIDLPQAFASSSVSFTGRSLAALADAPYQPVETYITDAPTTAAQLATLAQTFTGLDVQWQAPDWLIPAGAWSYQGTSLGVVGQVAAAIEAVVEAQRDGPALLVQPRYPVQPNLWATTPPDWQIHHSAIERSNSVRADTPEYNAVLVAGQQQGGVLTARYAGTSGAVQAPLVTDPLLTDGPALLERAGVILASAGKKADVSRTLQVGPEGVVPRGALVRFVDPDETWVGLVRSVAVQFSFGQARQTIGVERRTAFQSGVFVPPVVLRRDVLLDFEGIGDGALVRNFYNGGTSSFDEPGPDYGIYFEFNNDESASGQVIRQDRPTNTGIANAPSPTRVLVFNGSPSIPAFLNCPDGFTGPFGFWYASPAQSGTVTFHSEIDGGGTTVGTMTVNANGYGPDPGRPFAFWSYVETTLAGVAKSANFNALRGSVVFDDIRLRLATDPGTNPPPLPPLPAPPLVPSINLIAPSPASGPATVPSAAGQVVVSGVTAPVGYTLTASAGATVSPASGTCTPGTPATYTVTAAAPGPVTISVGNSGGLVNSAPVVFTATTAPPAITVQPQPVTVTAPASATFSVAATGEGTLSYQWRRNGVDIAGATSSSYTLNPTAGADTGAQFSCAVSNAAGTTVSTAATLTVNTAAPYSVIASHVWSSVPPFPGDDFPQILFRVTVPTLAAAQAAIQNVTSFAFAHDIFTTAPMAFIPANIEYAGGVQDGADWVLFYAAYDFVYPGSPAPTTSPNVGVVTIQDSVSGAVTGVSRVFT